MQKIVKINKNLQNNAKYTTFFFSTFFKEEWNEFLVKFFNEMDVYVRPGAWGLLFWSGAWELRISEWPQPVFPILTIIE